MRKIFVFVGVFTITSLLVSPTHAQSLSGSYVSNRGNSLIIRGNSYTYSRGRGEPWRTSGSVRSIGDNEVRFSGYLSYVCTRQGTTLVCGGGRRIWTKQ